MEILQGARTSGRWGFEGDPWTTEGFGTLAFSVTTFASWPWSEQFPQLQAPNHLNPAPDKKHRAIGLPDLGLDPPEMWAK
jgi:hypothetical protein